MSVSRFHYPEGTTDETATKIFFLRAEMAPGQEHTIHHASQIFFRTSVDQICDIATFEATVNEQFEKHPKPRVLKGELAKLTTEEIDPVTLMKEQYENSETLSTTFYFDADHTAVLKPEPPVTPWTFTKVFSNPKRPKKFTLKPTEETMAAVRDLITKEAIAVAMQALADQAETPTDAQIEEETKKATAEVTDELVEKAYKAFSAEYQGMLKQYYNFVKNPAHGVVVEYTFSGQTLQFAAACFRAESREAKMKKRIMSRGGYSKLPINSIAPIGNEFEFLTLLVQMADVISPTAEKEEIFKPPEVRKTARARLAQAPITVTLEEMPENPEEQNAFVVRHLRHYFQDGFLERAKKSASYADLFQGSKVAHAKVLALAEDYLSSQVVAGLIDEESEEETVSDETAEVAEAVEVIAEPETPRAPAVEASVAPTVTA